MSILAILKEFCWSNWFFRISFRCYPSLSHKFWKFSHVLISFLHCFSRSWMSCRTLSCFASLFSWDLRTNSGNGQFLDYRSSKSTTTTLFWLRLLSFFQPFFMWDKDNPIPIWWCRDRWRVCVPSFVWGSPKIISICISMRSWLYLMPEVPGWWWFIFWEEGL